MTRRLEIQLVFLAGLFCVSLVASAAPPNIVLIVADDLGYGDLGCYGAEAIPTPNIDKMATAGIRLTRCYASAATCTPSRYAMMTGEYAWRQTERQTTILDGNAPLAIDPSHPTLPGVLRQAGYRTALVGKWHLGIGDGKNPVDFNGHVGPGPLEVGFDEAFYIPATVDRVPCVFIENHRVHDLDPSDPLSISYERPFTGELLGKDHADLLKYPADAQHSGTIVNGISRIGFMRGGVQAHWQDESIAEVLVARSREFITRNSQRPFFLMLGTHDPHVPHAPHPRFVGKSRAGIRGDSIVQFDWLVGEVLESIKNAGLDTKTLVIVTSDNGPTVFDGYFDGSVEALGQHKPAGNLRGGKYTVYEGGCRVPFVARWPETINSGESSSLFSLMDLLPSLAKLAGAGELPAGTGRDSLELADVLTDSHAPSRRESLVLDGIFNSRAIVTQKWKYIPSNQNQLPEGAGAGANNQDERFALAQIQQDLLFDLEADPGEEKDLSVADGDQAAKLRSRLKEILGAE